jgi:TPP-dependent indolepyruvate ferredoxin oxidoreductase alpha subunit
VLVFVRLELLTPLLININKIHLGSVIMNNNDSLREKAIKANELENISGGERVDPTEKHPLDKSNSEAQSEKGINVNRGQLSLDKLKDTSGSSGARYDYFMHTEKCGNCIDCILNCPVLFHAKNVPIALDFWDEVKFLPLHGCWGCGGCYDRKWCEKGAITRC